MDTDALGKSPVGTLVPIRGTDARSGDYAYFAFVPSELPNSIDLTPATWTLVTKAAESIGRLDQACTQLPDSSLLIRPALWREALDTSALEGTHAALAEVLGARVAASQQFLSPEVVEIRAYEDIALDAFATVADLPITVGMLCGLQKRLADGSREKPRDPGNIRSHQVVIGPRGGSVYDARYVPPPADDRLNVGLESWERWIATEHEFPPLVAAALAHYQFEALHPFGDGNGRIGRLVIVLQLMKAGVLHHPAITLSPWFLRRRDEYQDHLLAISKTGDWNPWVQFFCEAMCAQSESVIAAAMRLLAWRQDVWDKLHERRFTGTVQKLASDLIEWPVVSIPFAARKYGVSVPTATRAVEHLVEIGVLTELTGKTYGRSFGATEVMQVVDRI